MQIVIINGPNLNLVGIREPEIYGHITMDEYIGQLKHENYPTRILHFQSNHEGEIIDLIHKYGFKSDGIILNAGAYTHTSIAIGDAVKSIQVPVVEVHISDISKREDYRRQSYISEGAAHLIQGEGLKGYKMALEYLESKSSD